MVCNIRWTFGDNNKVMSFVDQTETEYSNYEIANKNKFFDNGWIPKNMIYQSMTNIYLQNNIDLNSAIFSYNLSSPDIDSRKQSFIKLILNTEILKESMFRVNGQKLLINQIFSILLKTVLLFTLQSIIQT